MILGINYSVDKQWVKNSWIVVIIFLFLLLPKSVIAKEYTVDADEIRQLLCNILSQEDIPSFLEEMGTVEEETTREGRSTFYKWRIKTEMYSIRYARQYDKYNKLYGQKIMVFCRKSHTRFFQNKSEAKRWLAPYGTIVTDPDFDDIEAIGDGTLDNKIWYVSVADDLLSVSVHWKNEGNRHAERFCK